MLTRNIANHLRNLCVRRYASTDLSLVSKKYPIGLKLHGFEIQNTRLVPEFSLVAVLLKHEASGAQHLHLDSPNDHNNVFLIAFKTNAPDATGVPHILEHTTLCGSSKFPVRDPFFKMTNRSLSNFMNAMTGHDYTFYPFATTNSKDFDNLLDVYLSSVFQPLLTSNDFLQEGWRLENSDVQDINSKLEFKGVVFNEMKGQYSNSMYYFYIKFLESIYPSLNNSGGDPLNITDLTHQQLLEFHSKNYTPSNAKSFTYGNLGLDNHLRHINLYYTQYTLHGKNMPLLNHKREKQSEADIKLPIFETKKQLNYDVIVKGPVDTMSNKPVAEQFHSSITWYLGNPLKPNMQFKVFKWKVLGSLLFDGHNSPLYQELIETGYSEDFSANSGLDSTSALFSFTIGLNFLTKAKADALTSKVEDIIQRKVLPELRNPSSLYHKRVLALLHQFEIGLKKHKPDFGFGLLSSIVSSWTNGVDPIELLKVEEILTLFKNEFESRGLSMFEDLLNESILNKNSQTFKFTMEPDLNFNKNLANLESKNLEQKISQLTDKDRNELYNRNIGLVEYQRQEEDVSVLPTLTIQDIPQQGDSYPLINTKNNEGLSISRRVVDTNGLVYISGLKSLDLLPIEWYKYLPIFSSCLTNLAGTARTPITDLETVIQTYTGGLSFGAKIAADPYNINKMKLQYLISGVALEKNAPRIYDLWHEILSETRFTDDNDVLEKLTTLVRNLGQNQINNIADRGHSFACGESNSRLTPAKFAAEQMNGITQVQLIMEMNKSLDAHGAEYLKNELLPILRKIQSFVLAGQFKYRIVGNKDIVTENESLITKFDERISTYDPISVATKGDGSVSGADIGIVNLMNHKFDSYNPNLEKVLVNLPFQVGYSSLAKTGAPYSSRDGAALQILSQLYTFKNLHSKIRESNGAYGGGLNYDGLGGILDFYSYRDPNPIKSIETFQSSFAYGLDANWDSKDLTEAKLRIFQSVDAPINVASQGATEFYEGISDTLRQERRDNFLDINNQDLMNVTEKYLLNLRDAITVIANNDTLKVGEDWNVKNLQNLEGI